MPSTSQSRMQFRTGLQSGEEGQEDGASLVRHEIRSMALVEQDDGLNKTQKSQRTTLALNQGDGAVREVAEVAQEAAEAVGEVQQTSDQGKLDG